MKITSRKSILLTAIILLVSQGAAAYLDMSIPYAAGSMHSTVEDLYLWEALHKNHSRE
jgi:hypothetical protein